MRFISLFNTRTASAICILVALAYRIANVIYVSYLGRDKIILMQQSKNLLQGKGLSIERYYTSNLEMPIYDFTPFWPPGYPIVLAPFLKIFGYDLYWATISVDIVSVAAFIFIVRKILFEIEFPLPAVNIITLITGCFEYAFIYESAPTDILSFVLFLTGLLFILRSVRENEPKYLNLVIASIFLFLPCTFRYSYPPLSIAVPIGLVFIGWYQKNSAFIKKGLVSLAVISLLIITFLISLKTKTGSAGYIVDTGRGFFPENFIHWTPFIVESFINKTFATSQLINRTGISVSQGLFVLKTLNAVFFIGLAFVSIYLFSRRRVFKTTISFENFLLIGFFISAATCISLSYLTLTFRPQPGWGNYQEEPRYFMFINLYLQIAFVGWIFLYSSWKKSLSKKIIISVFSLLLFIEVTHNIYFQTKATLSPHKYVSPYEEQDYVYFINLIKSSARENPGTEIYVIADNDELFLLLTNYLGHKGIYDGFNLVKALPSVKRKTILILALYDNQIADYKSFITAQNAKFLTNINQVNFYRVDLLP